MQQLSGTIEYNAKILVCNRIYNGETPTFFEEVFKPEICIRKSIPNLNKTPC